MFGFRLFQACTIQFVPNSKISLKLGIVFVRISIGDLFCSFDRVGTRFRMYTAYCTAYPQKYLGKFEDNSIGLAISITVR